MTWLLWLALIACLLVLAAVGASAFGERRWAGAVQALQGRLEAGRTQSEPTRYDARELERLPAPVQRYFRAALTDGQAIVTAVSIRHAGTFNMSTRGEQWKPFTSRQRVITQRPGFSWDARVMMFPGVPVHVHDAYIAGTGFLHGAVLGLFTVVEMADTPEMAQGELMRFFAEAAWYPTALLPSQGVRWEAMDDSAAHATLNDGPLKLKLLFRFNAEGLIDTVRAESRGRVVDGKTVNVPWQGRFWRYAMQDGMRMPQEGEVAWLLPEGDKPYWRGTTLSATYEFANPPAH